MDVKSILSGLFERLSGLSKERPHAGQKYELLGITADLMDVIRQLRDDVLRRVSQEAVIDVDIDIDYSKMAELTLLAELPSELTCWQSDNTLSESLAKTEIVERLEAGTAEAFVRLTSSVDSLTLSQLVAVANETLGELNSVLLEIDAQLKRPHSKDEYARLYEAEKRRYLNSGTSGRVKQTFEEWREICDGAPTLENIADYRLEKLLHLFEKGGVQADHIHRATHYKDEIDFEQLDDETQKKCAYRHYAALRQMADWVDGDLVADPAKIGRMFYISRHDENAKARRGVLLKYLHKISLAQEERRKWLAASEAESQKPLNYYAPTRNLQELLKQEWFKEQRADKTYNESWTDAFVSALMASEWKDGIAQDWAIQGKRTKVNQIKGHVLGLLVDNGVLPGVYDTISAQVGITDNPRTFSRYMSEGKSQPYADWVKDYITGVKE